MTRRRGVRHIEVKTEGVTYDLEMDQEMYDLFKKTTQDNPRTVSIFASQGTAPRTHVRIDNLRRRWRRVP